MRFLIDANMPRSAAELLKRYDHEPVDIRDIGMGGADDSNIAVYAQENGLAIVTRDFVLPISGTTHHPYMLDSWFWHFRKTPWQRPWSECWSHFSRTKN